MRDGDQPCLCSQGQRDLVSFAMTPEEQVKAKCGVYARPLAQIANRYPSSPGYEVAAGFSAEDIERWHVQIRAWLTLQHQKATDAGPRCGQLRVLCLLDRLWSKKTRKTQGRLSGHTRRGRRPAQRKPLQRPPPRPLWGRSGRRRSRRPQPWRLAATQTASSNSKSAKCVIDGLGFRV